MPVSILSALHTAATGAVFAYMHLFKHRGCRCVTERPDFCRLYVASAMLFGWRVLLLGLRAARPSVFMYDRSGRPDALAIGVNAALYLAFFVFFARFAYDVWLGRALTGAAPGDAAAACACATEKRDQRLLGIGALVYGLAMILSASATLVLLTALSVMR
jgi:hypothetical protein